MHESIDGGGMLRVCLAVLGVLVSTGCTIQISSGPTLDESATPPVTNSPETTRTPGIPAGVPTEETVNSRPTQVSEPAYSPESNDVQATDKTRLCPPDISLPEGIDPRYCGNIPEDATDGQRAEHFTTPSGNIACDMQEESVTCEARETSMIADFHNPEGDGQCNGFVLDQTAAHMCHSEPILWDGFYSDPTGWPEQPYGNPVFVFEKVCEVDESGLICWNSETGHGFFLSRTSYAHW